MTCIECQGWIQRLLDGEALPPEEALSEHLSECAPCRHFHASAHALLRVLRVADSPRASADFTQRLTALVLADRQARQWRARSRLLVTAGLAACILVMALAGHFFLPVPRDGQSTLVEKKPDTSQKEAGPTASPRWADSVDHARQAVAALSQRWANRA